MQSLKKVLLIFLIYHTWSCGESNDSICLNSNTVSLSTGQELCQILGGSTIGFNNSVFWTILYFDENEEFRDESGKNISFKVQFTDGEIVNTELFLDPERHDCNLGPIDKEIPTTTVTITEVSDDLLNASGFFEYTLACGTNVFGDFSVE